MKIIHVVFCYLLSAALCVEASPYGVFAEGYEGGEVTFRCSHSQGPLYSNNIYLFKQSDILVQATESKKVTQGRYSLENTGDGKLTVTIKELKKSDSGTYWCQVIWTDQGVYLSVKDAIPIFEVPHFNPRPFKTTSNIPTTFPNLPATSTHHTTPGPIRDHTTPGPIRDHTTPGPIRDHTTSPPIMDPIPQSAVLGTPVIIMVFVSLAVLVPGLILLLIYKWRRDRKASRPVPNSVSPTQNITYQTLKTATQDSTYQTLKPATQDSTYQTLKPATQDSTYQTLNTAPQDSTYQTLKPATQDSTYQTLKPATQDSTYQTLKPAPQNSTYQTLTKET
ncbi:hypothetical protein UPYG_G00060590 [Umbra pygmaea]|uniref:Ig-like domain-containing protein n=1 Tax=Umbra pygmaea TaxID=75934 RepID=A0ABD0X9A3_UMBPY